MEFLADESCDFAIVRASRSAGHDVLAVAEVLPHGNDKAIMELARTTSRILLTEDKDFGQLVYADHLSSGGVIFLRYPAQTRELIAESIVRLVEVRGDDLKSRFIVVMPGRVRIGKKSGA
jgi:predicted nuclease of predicted toxin-antitoxin system